MRNHVLLEFKKFISIFCISTATLFIFTGCENFLKSEEVKQEFISAVDYNNAPTYTIHVTEIKGSGQVKTPVSGEVAKKVTDTFTIKFDPDADHQFIRWQAVIGDMKPGETADDYISFEDPEKLETKATLKKASGDILIQPVCPQKLTVKLNDIDTAKVYPRDTTIQLEFNNPVAEGCKDKVIVVIPDIPKDRTALSYFKPAEQNEKLISLFADVAEDNYSNMIPVTAAGKVITVRLNAGDFYYENTDYSKTNPEKIYLENDAVFTYTINNSTSRTTKFKYKVEDNVSGAGLFRIDEENLEGSTQEYSVGKIINLKYTLTNYEDYVFKGWAFTYAESEGAPAQTVTLEEITGLSYADNSQTIVYDSLTHTAQTSLKLYNYNSGIITISPVVEVIPLSEIVLEGSRGKISPAKGKHQIHKGELMSLSFDPDDDYEFIHWQVYDAATDQPFNYTEYLNIDINSSETSIKLLQTPPQNVKLALRPVVTERPQVISATPSYDIKGAYRDARIQVAFDRDMDENSIYFTTDEIGVLLNDTSVSELLPEYDENDTTKKYYGYIKEGSIFYKNIQITDNRDTSKNLLACFDAPYFENAKTLIIPTNVNNYPVGGTTLLVTLDKNFFVMEQNKPVTLREAKKWIYFVNSKTDTEAPEITEVEILCSNGEINESASLSDALWINSDKVIKLFITATDLGNGPAESFYMIFDSTSGCITRDPIKIEFESVVGAYANCGARLENGNKQYYEIDLSEYQFQNGNYKFYLEFSDKTQKQLNGYLNTGNAVKYGVTDTHPNPIYYTFRMDDEKPQVTNLAMEACTDDNDDTKTALKFSFDDFTDTVSGTKGIQVTYRPAKALTDSAWGDWTDATLLPFIPVGNAVPDITGLNYGSTYEIKIKFTDNADNAVEYLYKKNTMPAAFDASKIYMEADEIARVIKVHATEKPAGTNGVQLNSKKIGYANGDKSEKCFTDGNTYFGCRKLSASQKYSMTIQSINKEVVEGTQYSNNGCTYENINPTIVTVLDSNGNDKVITKPIGAKYVINNGTQNRGISARRYNSIDFYYNKENGGSQSITGVKITYAPYNSDGTLGTAESQTFVGADVTDNKITIQNLSPATHYQFKIETYYLDETHLCSEGDALYYDGWTKPNPVKSSHFQVYTNNQPQSAVLTWVKPEGDFDYYIVTYGSTSAERQKLRVDKNLTTCTITNLQAQRYYNFYIWTVKGKDSPSYGYYGNTTAASSGSAPVMTVDIDFDNSKAISKNQIQIKAINKGSSDVYLWYSNNYQKVAEGNADCTKIKISDSSIEQTISSLSANTNYYFVFRASNQASSAKCSEIIEIKTKNSTYSANLENTKVVVDPHNPNTVNLSWDTSGEAQVSYRELKTTSTGGDYTELNGTYSNSCSIEGLESGKMYEFKILISDIQPKGDLIGRTIPYPLPADLDNSVETDDIENLRISDYGDHFITLSWNLKEGFTCESYNIYRDSTLIAENVWGTVTSITEANLDAAWAPAESYYTVIACNSSGNVKQKVKIQNTKFVNPVTFAINYFDDYRAYFSWKHKTDESHKNGYLVSYKKSSESEWNVYSAGGNTSYTTTSPLERGIQYDFKVETKGNNADSSDNSEGVTLTQFTPPVPVTVSENAVITADSITVNWENPAGPYNNTVLRYGYTNGYGHDVLTINSSATDKPVSYTFKYLEPDTEYKFIWYTYSDITRDDDAPQSVVTKYFTTASE